MPEFSFLPENIRIQLSGSFIEEQEKQDAERRQREEEAFQKLEEERNKRAELLKKQREEEQKKMQEEWDIREQQVRKQIEEDKKRLAFLLESQNLLQEKTAKELAKQTESQTKVVAKSPVVVPTPDISVEIGDEELESMFEPLSDEE